MRQIQLGSHTVRSHGYTVARQHMHDWLILILLLIMIFVLNAIPPFYRFVGKDMMVDLKYPFKNNTVPIWAVPVGFLFVSPNAMLVMYISHMQILVDEGFSHLFYQLYSVLLPITIFLIIYFRRRDVYDLHHAILGDNIFGFTWFISNKSFYMK